MESASPFDEATLERCETVVVTGGDTTEWTEWTAALAWGEQLVDWAHREWGQSTSLSRWQRARPMVLLAVTIEAVARIQALPLRTSPLDWRDVPLRLVLDQLTLLTAVNLLVGSACRPAHDDPTRPDWDRLRRTSIDAPEVMTAVRDEAEAIVRALMAAVPTPTQDHELFVNLGNTVTILRAGHTQPLFGDVLTGLFGDADNEH